MSLLSGLILAALAILVVLHMARPRFRRQRLSAARFFTDLPAAKDTKRRFQVGSPLRSRPLYTQFLLLALLAGALLSTRGCERELEERLGVWVLVDTSLSMTTALDMALDATPMGTRAGKTRLDAARREVQRFLDRAEKVGSGPPCFRFSTFDLAIDPARPEAVDRSSLERRLDSLVARPLGTDLGLLRELATAENSDKEGLCSTQVRLVVTDLPAPDWAGQPGSGWIWRDVGQPVSNVGLISALAVRDPFAGLVDAVVVEVAAYGQPPRDARLEVLDTQTVVVESLAINWPAFGPWHCEIALPKAGLYQLRVTPGGAYSGDDEALIEVPEGDRLRVDWRLPSSQWARRLSWNEVTPGDDVDLTVVPLSDVPLSKADSELLSTRTVLVLGDQYDRQVASGPRTASEIGFFEADSPLLDGVNFDVVEEARILGVAVPAGFKPVLAGGRPERDTWVARRDHPPGVYLPGLPTGGDDSVGRLSATLFVHALRWLLSGTPPSALYSLTSPARPEMDGTRIALHPGEGKTDHTPLSRGDVGELSASVQRPVHSPAWPWWLAAAAGVFLVEQALLAFGGESWR